MMITGPMVIMVSLGAAKWVKWRSGKYGGGAAWLRWRWMGAEPCSGIVWVAGWGVNTNAYEFV
jgi:hypothetical protein